MLMPFKKQTFQLFLMLLITGVLAGLIVVWMSNSSFPRGRITNDNSKIGDLESLLINPTVLANIDKHYIINFKSLRDKILKIQREYAQRTFAYFVYLPNAVWTGVGEREMFVAASTVKVPLTMAVLKAEEQGKLALGDVYTVTEEELNHGFGALYKNGANQEITIEELIKLMLAESDNTAMEVLLDVLKNVGIDDPLADVYQAMGWEYVAEFGAVPSYRDINLKTLSNMFLSLYNATYLSLENSHKVLQYLTESPFASMIPAGVPDDVPVAHKIGVFAPENVYSDCGIVYAPERHYILCAAMEGGSEAQAAKFISAVSKEAYQFVINN